MWFIVILLVGCTGNFRYSTDQQEGEYHEINSFSEPVVLRVVDQLKDKRVLFVFDIDNTLLVFPNTQFTGSDQWYKWQESLPVDSQQKVNCVFEMQTIAYRLQFLKGTEEGESAEFVRSLQESGKDVIALTARNHDLRAVTERELTRNGVSLHPKLPQVLH